MTFRLPLLLYVMAVLAACLATFGGIGVVVFLTWGMFALHIANRSNMSTQRFVKELCVIIAFIVLLLALLLPAAKSAREAGRRMECSSNLKQIALALQNYQSVFRRFPPAIVYDQDGKPMHSWRTIVMPYLVSTGTTQYDLTSPWNSAKNQGYGRALGGTAPGFYVCPADTNRPPMHTNYMLVVGPKTVVPDTRQRRLSEVVDGTSRTIMVVESTRTVHWMEPRDMTFDEAVDTTSQPCLSSAHTHHKNSFFFSYEQQSHCSGFVALADGSILYLQGPLTPESMAEWLSVADGGPNSDTPRVLPEHAHPSNAWRYNWRNFSSLSILILLILMPIVWRPWKVQSLDDQESLDEARAALR